MGRHCGSRLTGEEKRELWRRRRGRRRGGRRYRGGLCSILRPGCGCRWRWRRPRWGHAVVVVEGVEQAHADAAIDDRVLHEAFAREGCVIARGPDRRAEGFKRLVPTTDSHAQSRFCDFSLGQQVLERRTDKAEDMEGQSGLNPSIDLLQGQTSALLPDRQFRPAKLQSKGQPVDDPIRVTLKDALDCVAQVHVARPESRA
jgi:hypothetical protein